MRLNLSRAKSALCVLLALAAPAPADPPRIAGTLAVDQYRTARLWVEADAAYLKGAAFAWDVTPDDAADVEELPGGKLRFSGPPGKYQIKLTVFRVVEGAPAIDRLRAVVEMRGVPQPPEPPTPGPGPKPPEPPTPAPIPAPGLRVLIVYDSANEAKMPAAQANILYAAAVRSYLREKCVKDADNPNGAFRIWDQGVDASGESKSWQDAMKRPRASVPWLIVSNGTAGYEGPLPANADDFLNTVKKYADTKGGK